MQKTNEHRLQRVFNTMHANVLASSKRSGSSLESFSRATSAMGPNITTGLRNPAAHKAKTDSERRLSQTSYLHSQSRSDFSPSLSTTLSYAGNFVWTGWEDRSSLLFLRFLLELRSPRNLQKSALSPPAVLGRVYCTLESCSALCTCGREAEAAHQMDVS